MYERCGKRAFDLVFSALALAVFAVPLLVIALLVWARLGAPVLFRQRRVGLNGREFLLVKFRTMTEARDAGGVYLPDSERMTGLGKFLRATSMDELPSLMNVLKGEMSVIGPRPLPVRYLTRYTAEQLRRHEVRPGLSNVAIVHGRNAQSWDDQFALDVWYVDHVSFLIDLKSVLDTLRIVFTRRGATAEDGGARCEFIGTADVNALLDADRNYMKIDRSLESGGI